MLRLLWGSNILRVLKFEGRALRPTPGVPGRASRAGVLKTQTRLASPVLYVTVLVSFCSTAVVEWPWSNRAVLGP